MTRILDFSLGPVQGFVAQARRTRDLWAGSFLLSWLSGRAMHALEGHGEILFPAVKGDQLYDALLNGGSGPRIGSLPNRFKARVDSDIDAGALCREAVMGAWQELSTLVWKTFLAGPAQHGNHTREIWDLQIENFWEVMWTCQDKEDYLSSALDARKNWRTHSSPDEVFGSDHCMLMPDWQELSGYARARKGGREKQQAFWRAVGGAVSGALYHDQTKPNLELRETERLCAMALVKRLFPTLFDIDATRQAAVEALGFTPEDTSRRELRNWRSTAHIAASPWMIGIEAAKQTRDYGRRLNALAQKHDARGVLYAEPGAVVGQLHGNPLERADGRLFYRDAILNRRADSWGKPVSQDAALRNDLADALGEVTKSYGAPTRFYAVLVMDGDRLGTHLSHDPTKSGPKISACLAEFTDKVTRYSAGANHVLIYAGGDDVLGLFPITEALSAARKYRGFYEQSFEGSGIATTLSGAIVFAPYDAPLSRSVREAHRLLDDVAKDRNGRDSLAVAVSKALGGETGWVAKWGVGCSNVDALEALAVQLRNEEMSSSYLYKLQRNYGDRLIADDDADFESTLRAILLAEAMVGKDRRKPEILQQAEAGVDALCKACVFGEASERSFNVEAALTARFLAAELHVSEERA